MNIEISDVPAYKRKDLRLEYLILTRSPTLVGVERLEGGKQAFSLSAGFLLHCSQLKLTLFAACWPLPRARGEFSSLLSNEEELFTAWRSPYAQVCCVNCSQFKNHSPRARMMGGIVAVRSNHWKGVGDVLECTPC